MAQRTQHNKARWTDHNINRIIVQHNAVQREFK